MLLTQNQYENLIHMLQEKINSNKYDSQKYEEIRCIYQLILSHLICQKLIHQNIPYYKYERAIDNISEICAFNYIETCKQERVLTFQNELMSYINNTIKEFSEILMCIKNLYTDAINLNGRS